MHPRDTGCIHSPNKGDKACGVNVHASVGGGFRVCMCVAFVIHMLVRAFLFPPSVLVLVFANACVWVCV